MKEPIISIAPGFPIVAERNDYIEEISGILSNHLGLELRLSTTELDPGYELYCLFLHKIDSNDGYWWFGDAPESSLHNMLRDIRRCSEFDIPPFSSPKELEMKLELMGN